MRLTFNGVVLSAESVRAAREWFADNARRCAEEAREGRLRVNDPASYVSAREAYAAEVLSGAHDYSVAFLQRAYYIQTGESVALLP